MNTIEIDHPPRDGDKSHSTSRGRMEFELSGAPLQRNAQRNPRVLLVMWSIPHYRVPIFSRLSRNSSLDFTVAAGEDIVMYDGSRVAGPTEAEAVSMNWRRIESKRLRWPLTNWEWQPEAVRMVMRDQYDCVVVFGNRSLSNYMIKLICAIRRIPIMEWSQGVLIDERGLKLFLRKLTMYPADALLLYGDFARDFFAAHGYSRDRVYAVHNSLDYERQVAIRRTISQRDSDHVRESFGVVSPEQRLIVHSGRLEAFKNIPFLLAALGEMKRRGRSVHLVLVGSGRAEHSLRSLAREYGIADRVIFYGACYDEDILARIYSAADLSVVPGPAGLVVMHMLVYGTPVLTYDGWQMPEVEAVIEGETGAYYREGDLDHLETRMEELLFPAPAKRRMSENCMRIIEEQYTPAYQERIFLDALRHVLLRKGHETIAGGLAAEA